MPVQVRRETNEPVLHPKKKKKKRGRATGSRYVQSPVLGWFIQVKLGFAVAVCFSVCCLQITRTQNTARNSLKKKTQDKRGADVPSESQLSAGSDLNGEPGRGGVVGLSSAEGTPSPRQGSARLDSTSCECAGAEPSASACQKVWNLHRWRRKGWGTRRGRVRCRCSLGLGLQGSQKGWGLRGYSAQKQGLHFLRRQACSPWRSWQREQEPQTRCRS